MGSLLYILSTRVDLCFAVHNLEKFSSNTGKVHFEGLVQLLRYIRYNRNSRIKYYAKINYAPISDLFIQDSINIDNQLIIFSDSIWQKCLDIGRIKVEYILFYQG